MPSIAPLASSGLRIGAPLTLPLIQYPTFQAAPIPSFGTALWNQPTRGQLATASLGSALEGLQDAATQSGLRNVLSGKPYNEAASDSFGDRLAASVCHAFDGTLGQNEGTPAPSPYDRGVAGLSAADSVIPGPNGRLSYDPARAIAIAGQKLALEQGGYTTQAQKLALDARKRAAAWASNPRNLFDQGTPEGGPTPAPSSSPATSRPIPVGSPFNPPAVDPTGGIPSIDAPANEPPLPFTPPSYLQPDAQVERKPGEAGYTGSKDNPTPRPKLPPLGANDLPLPGNVPPAFPTPPPRAATTSAIPAGSPLALPPEPTAASQSPFAPAVVSASPFESQPFTLGTASARPGSPLADVPSIGDQVLAYAQDNPETLTAAGGPAAPRMSTAAPKAPTGPSAADRKAAEASTALQSPDDVIPIYGRYGVNNAGQRVFLSNAQIRANPEFGMTPGSEVKLVPKFYSETLPDGQVRMMQRDPHGGKDAEVGRKSEAEANFDALVKKYPELDSSMSGEITRRAQTMGTGGRLGEKVRLLSYNLVQELRKPENEGRPWQDVLGDMQTASPQITSKLVGQFNSDKRVQQFQAVVVDQFQSLMNYLNLPESQRDRLGDQSAGKLYLQLLFPGKTPTVHDLKEIQDLQGMPERVKATLLGLVGSKGPILSADSIRILKSNAEREFEARGDAYQAARDTWTANARNAGVSPQALGPNMLDYLAKKREEYAKKMAGGSPAAGDAAPTPTEPAAPASAQPAAAPTSTRINVTKDGQTVSIPIQNLAEAQKRGWAP